MIGGPQDTRAVIRVGSIVRVARAGKDDGYYVNHYSFAGAGWLQVWYGDPRYLVGGKEYDLQGTAQEPVRVLPGDTYRFAAFR